MNAIDTDIAEPAVKSCLLMSLDDVFSNTGRGTVPTGRIVRGVVMVGEVIEIVGMKDTVKTTVTGVEMFRKQLDQGMAGDNVGLLLRGVERDTIERGQVLSKPGSITPHTTALAELYVLSKDEGGRHTPFFDGYRPQFFFGTADVTGITDPALRWSCQDNLTVTVELGKNVARKLDSVLLSVKVAAPLCRLTTEVVNRSFFNLYGDCRSATLCSASCL